MELLKRYVRLVDALPYGITKKEILEIYHTPGQTMIRKITPGRSNSPFMIDVKQLSEYLEKRAQESTPERGRVV